MNKKSTSSNFGAKGWGIVGFTGLMMFINGIIHTNGLNILTVTINGQKGWDVSTMLTMNTIAGIIGVFVSFITGRLIIKFGAKQIGGIFLILGGLVIIWFGIANNLIAFFLALTFLWIFSDGYGQMVPFTLVAQWFPKRKGLALGWATMGYPLCSIFAVPILLALFGAFGFSNAFLVFGIIQIVFGILTFLVIKNHPEEAGAYPDNDKSEIEELHIIAEKRKSYKSKLTVKALLKDKNMWSIALAMGFLWMATIGIISQLVPRFLQLGYDVGSAVKFLQLAAICGIFGSYFFGWLDQKIGTRKTTMIYSWCYVAVLLALGFGNGIGWLLFAVAFGGFGTGAICNLLPSYIGTVYGHKDFAIANGVVAPIASIIRCLNFLVLGLGLLINNTYTPSYLFFAFLALIAFFLVLRTKKVHEDLLN